MCGINGIWHTDGRTVNSGILKTATRLQAHRGPDDEGFLWFDTRSGAYTENDPCDLPADLALGFRRLAILDLSPIGHQPMRSENGDFWIVFNGEIYNYLELRHELQMRGHRFQSGTDTEVILAAYTEWGESCLERFNGMWAFALWDSHCRRLFCARDRFGVKPFYYTWQAGAFVFASEIKAILPFCTGPLRPNDPLVYDFLVYGWLDHTPETFFTGINQLPPSHYMVVQDGCQTLTRYWRLDPEKRLSLPSSEAYAERFRELFEDAVHIHLRSDVAVGTCLSGGLDSSSIVCVANGLLLEKHTLPANLVGERQKTFSSCFDDSRFDERPFIEQVLQATEAESNYVFPNGAQLVEALPRIIWHQEQPFVSTSIFAQWCVMERVAQRGVRVLLDGQGGDELLGGYHSYFQYLWNGLARRGDWRALGREISAYRSQYPLSLLRAAWWLGQSFVPPGLADWLRQFKRDGWNIGTLGLAPEFVRLHTDRAYQSSHWRGEFFEDHLYDSLMIYSLPALLRYEDRDSMAHSIEARVPFLDYRFAEFAVSLPPEQKIHDALTKVVMRNAMRGILPEEVRLRRDKMGFVTPEKVWLDAELGILLQDVVNSPHFSLRGYYDASLIQRLVAEHHEGKRDLSFIASRWLTVELWFRTFIDRGVDAY